MAAWLPKRRLGAVVLATVAGRRGLEAWYCAATGRVEDAAWARLGLHLFVYDKLVWGAIIRETVQMVHVTRVGWEVGPVKVKLDGFTTAILFPVGEGIGKDGWW